ncbi:uncharacterized protein LOC115314978 isoform X2 [Ixodes scapularis]|uniref:uncharacterized protein LOC115314978 isoform X2 n=1 Tax=Ixodes scapularis TaxID=6945 RepID=UPI001C3860C2|nr:uncharacterized protein LOC115314978 isoform X2 [Ixodes scapularis]
MKTCCVYKCGACNADAVSLFRFPRDRSLRDKWLGMIGVVSFNPHNSHAVCSRHFTADLIVQAGRAARLREGAYPTLRLERPPAAESAGKLEVGRAVQEDTLPSPTDKNAHSGDCGLMPPPNLLPGGQWNNSFVVKEERQEESANSPSEGWRCEDIDGLSPSHGHLNVDEAAAVVVKKEPEEILGTPMGEDMHSEDCGRASSFPLHLEGGMDNTFAVKEELDDRSAFSTCEDFYREDAHCLPSSHDHLEKDEATPVVVKDEPDELAALHIEDEGSYSAALDPLATNQVPLEGHWSDCPLPVIEVPDEILPSLTVGSSRYEDCSRMPPSQLGLEGCWSNNSIVKEEKTEFPAVQTSESSWSGLSGSKSPRRVNQEEHWGSGPVCIKREPEDTPAASPREASDWEDTCGPCTSPEPPNEVQRAAIVLKEDPNEFAALRIDEGWDSGALGSALPSPVQLKQHWKDTPLCPREVPDEMLPSLTGGSSCYEDCGRMPPSQLGLEGCWTDNCVVKEEKTELPAVQTSEGSWSGLSGSKSPLLINQGGHWGSGPVRVKQEKTELPAAQTSKGSWSGLSGSESSLQVNQEGHWGSGPVRIKREPGDTPDASPCKASDWENACGPCTSLEPPNEVQKTAVVPKEDPDEFAALRIDEGSGSGALGSALPSPVQLERHWEDTPLCPGQETDDASAVLRIKGLDCEGACGPSSPLRPVNGVEAATAVVKGEPDEFVTLRIDDGSCFEPLESLLSLQVQLEGPCKEGPLRHLIEDLVDGEDKSTDRVKSSSLTFSQGQLDEKRRKTWKCGSMRHECRFCPYSSASRNTVTEHERIHTGEKPFKCNYCQRAFTFKSSLDYHVRTHTGAKPFKCNVCQRAFAGRSSLMVHLRIHTGERPYKCSVCPKTYVKRFSLDIHVRSHTGARPFKCSICQKAFTSGHSLKVHVETHSDSRPFTCPICPKAFRQRSRLDSHARVHRTKKSSERHKKIRDDGPPFKCSSCCKVFTEKGQLEAHGVVHMGREPLKCSACPKVFRWKSQLNLHKSIHSSEKPYECDICGRRFKWKVNFTVHQVKHSNALLFKCPTCPKVFQWKSSLSSHQRVHKRERPYRCRTCPKAFRLKASLMQHELFHQGTMTYRCITCSKAFRLECHLKHEKALKREKSCRCNTCSEAHADKHCLDDLEAVSVHKKPFKCSICSRAFYWRSSLKAHRMTHIGEMPHKSKSRDISVEEQHPSAQMAGPPKRQFLLPPKSYPNASSNQKVFHLKFPFSVRSIVYKGKIYKCKTCAMAFTRKQLLGAHLGVHTG